MAADLTPFVTPIVTAVIAASGTYAAMASRLARLETKMDDLGDDVRKHNGVVERTAGLEHERDAIWRAINDLKADVKDIKENRHD